MKRLPTIAMTALLLLAGCTSGETEPQDSWRLLASDVTATVYNATAAQCNDDCLHTASMMKIHPDRIAAQRILAMERTMMAEYGLSYGAIVRIEGAGACDGVWQLQDTMNRRFAGQHKIDLLVDESVRHGRWTDVTLYVAADAPTAERYARSLEGS